jgi:hypothetical protein
MESSSVSVEGRGESLGAMPLQDAIARLSEEIKKRA